MSSWEPKNKIPSQMRASDIEALQPWDPSRTTIKLVEIPLLLKRIYNITTSYGAALRWARDGVIRKSDGQRIYLKCRKFGRWRVVAKADLLAFLEEEFVNDKD